MSARRALLLLAACLSGGCASLPAPAPVTATALANPGFEEALRRPDCPPAWSCLAHANPKSFRFFLDETAPASGKHALCIEPSGYEPWAYASQGIFDRNLGGHRVRFSMAVRVEGVTGPGAGVLLHAHDGGGRIVAREQRLVAGTAGWQRLSVEMDVPANPNDVEVGATLNGRGRACFDDARLEVVR